MENLSCFAPHVLKQVEVVLNKRRIGIGQEKVVVKNPRSSSNIFNNKVNCDRFTLMIPYAGASVECIVIFQATDPECPPDFMFADMKFFVPVTEIQSLREWDARRNDGLYRALKEIMAYYKKKNIEDLERYSELHYDYLSLYQIKNFNEDDIEIYVPVKSKLPITFLIRLHVEFCDILPDVSEKNRYDSALLLLIFPDRESDKCSQRLYFSQAVKNALGCNGNFEFPGNMREYQLNRVILAVEDKLRCQVDLVASRYESRKTYIAKFLSHFSKCVVEYDILYFHNIILLLEVEDFNFLLEINLSENYPFAAPDLIFRSIYHTNMGVPSSVVVDTYPYCSTWSLDKVFNETVKFIQTYALLLKDDSDPRFYSPTENISPAKKAPAVAAAAAAATAAAAAAAAAATGAKPKKEKRSPLLNFRMDEAQIIFEGGSEIRSGGIYSEGADS